MTATTTGRVATLLAAALTGTLLATAAAGHHSDSLYFIDDRSADGGASIANRNTAVNRSTGPPGYILFGSPEPKA